MYGEWMERRREEGDGIREERREMVLEKRGGTSILSINAMLSYAIHAVSPRPPTFSPTPLIEAPESSDTHDFSHGDPLQEVVLLVHMCIRM
jgi:hypothetical protein